jgi:hypothetical protein
MEARMIRPIGRPRQITSKASPPITGDALGRRRFFTDKGNKAGAPTASLFPSQIVTLPKPLSGKVKPFLGIANNACRRRNR